MLKSKTHAAVFFLGVVICLAAQFVPGCKPIDSEPPGQNTPVLHETGQVKAHLDNVDIALTNARNFIAEFMRRVQAHIDDPKANPLPTPQETTDVLRKTDEQLQTAQKASKGAREHTDKTQQVADQQQVDFDKKLAAAVDVQKKHDRFIGNILVSAALGYLGLSLFERNSNFTFLAALPFGLIIAGLVFSVFDYVVDMVIKALSIAFWTSVWSLSAIILAGLGYYIYKRIKTGGSLLGILRNVELAVKN